MGHWESPIARVPRHRWLPAQVILGMALCSVTVGLTYFQDPRINTIGQTSLKFSCLTVILLGLKLHRPTDRRVWHALAAYFALTGIRNLSRTAQAFTDGTWTYLTGDLWEIVLNIAATSALAVSSIHLLRCRGRTLRWSLSDAWVLGTAVTLTVFILAVLPLLHRYGTGATFWNAGVIAVVRDTSVLIPVVAIWYSESVRLPALALYCGGISLLMVGDLIYLIGGARIADFGTGPVIVTALSGGQAMVAMAAVAPSMVHISRPADSPRPPWNLARVAVMGGTCLLPVFALLLAGPFRNGDLEAVFVGIGVLIAMILWRLRRAVTEADRSLREATHLALHDTLTDLPNGRFLHTTLLRQIEDRVRAGQRVVLGCCYLDVDGLKDINDSFQHGAGDRLLLSLSEALREVEGADVLRLGGDEFLVLTRLSGPAAEWPDQSEALARRVCELGNPGTASTEGFQRSVSVGSSWAELRPEDPDVQVQLDTLIHQADLAQVEAKRAGGHRAVQFRSILSDLARRRRTISASVPSAWERGEMSLAFQPVVDAVDGSIYGVESLLRWHHADLGHIPPDEAVAIAVQSGRINELGLAILRRSLEYAADLPPGQRIGVNLSAPQLRPGAVDELITVILASGRAEQLWLEVTEQILVEERGYVSRALADLRAVGVVIAIDDFGTGYCGLDYLCTIPVDIVKLDKVFAQEILESATRRRVARLGVQLAESIGAITLAEGVESVETAAAMTDLGCTLLQGYGLRRPGHDLAVASAPLLSHAPGRATDTLRTRTGTIPRPMLPGPSGARKAPEPIALRIREAAAARPVPDIAPEL